MCQECWQNPCHPRCPNSEHYTVGNCSKCGEELYEYYEIWTDCDNNQFCSEDCAKDYYGIKEMEY